MLSGDPLQRAIRQVPFPVMIHTESGEVLFLSKAWVEMSGYSPQDLPTYSDWTEKALGERWSVSAQEIDRLFETGEVLNEGEYIVTTRDRRERVWDMSVVSFGKSEQGKRMVMRMASDVTERNLAEKMLKGWNEQLEASVQERTKELNDTVEALKIEIAERKRIERYKDDILYSVSHELRTPLSITKQGISMVMREIPGALNKEQRDILTIARDNIDRLARMINSLLDMSKLKAGKVELRRVSVDLGKLMEDVGRSFQVKLAEKNLGLKVAAAPGCPPAYADPDRVFQVFTNLVGNAAKFTEKGNITLSAQPRGEDVECAVTDTGRGIAKEDLSRVFGKFEQFGRVEGAGEKGTGLGLAISKALVELHRGRIWIESELEKGTRFAFTLPRYSPGIELRTFVLEGLQLAQERTLGLALLLIENASPGDTSPAPVPPGWTEEKTAELSRWFREWVSACVERRNEPMSRASASSFRFPGGLAAVLVGFKPEEALRLREELKGALRGKTAGAGVELNVGFASTEECRDEVQLIAKAKGSLARRE